MGAAGVDGSRRCRSFVSKRCGVMRPPGREHGTADHERRSGERMRNHLLLKKGRLDWSGLLTRLIGRASGSHHAIGTSHHPAASCVPTEVGPDVRRGNCWTGRVAVWWALLAVIGCSEKRKEAPAPTPARFGALRYSVRPGGPPGPSSPLELEGLVVRRCESLSGVHPDRTGIKSTDTSLIDTDGHIVRTWHCGCLPAMGATLLENGNLLRAGELPKRERPFEQSGGGGRIQEFTWNGELVWDFRSHPEREGTTPRRSQTAQRQRALDCL